MEEQVIRPKPVLVLPVTQPEFGVMPAPQSANVASGHSRHREEQVTGAGKGSEKYHVTE